MKNDKYYGSLRSRDNRWGEVSVYPERDIIITANIHFIESVYN